MSKYTFVDRHIGPRDAEIKEIAKRVGFVFQNPENQIFMFSVERDIAFGLENLGIEQEINGIIDALKSEMDNDYSLS